MNIERNIKGAKTAVAGIMLGAMLSSCGGESGGAYSASSAIETRTPEQVTLLEKKGILGDHELIDLRDVVSFDVHGSASGGLLLLNGVVDGKTTQEIQFAWRTNNPTDSSIIISQLPIDRFFFKNYDPGVKDPKPVVSFNFNMDALITTHNCGISLGDGICADAHDLGDDPHLYINPLLVDKASITMTPTQFEQFRNPR